jgi:hypothetical protein
MTLCDRGKTRCVACLLPFMGASPLRGVYIGEEPKPQPTAPILLADDQITLRARTDIAAQRVAVFNP